MRSVTYNYSGTKVDQTHPTRTVTFEANDGAVLSNTTGTRLINITGAAANPPVVTGTSTTPVAWNQTLPPAAAPVVTVAPSLNLSDGATSQLTGALVSISAGFVSGQERAGWNNIVATADGITVTASTKNRTLTLTGNATVATYQAVLQTVTYTNSSQNPTAGVRTVTVTVTDSNSITSTVTAHLAASRQVQSHECPANDYHDIGDRQLYGRGRCNLGRRWCRVDRSRHRHHYSRNRDHRGRLLGRRHFGIHRIKSALAVRSMRQRAC